MKGNANELMREFDKVDKEFNDLYREAASKMGISDSSFLIFYTLYTLGDGCLQKDICSENFVNKQTINSAIRKLEQEGLLYLQQGRGRDKHIYLTETGKMLIEKHFVPLVQKENEAFAVLKPQEQTELLRLTRKYIESLKIKLNELL